VASVAADDVAAGEARVKPEFVTEYSLVFADFLAADFGDFVGDRFENGIGSFAQLISVRCAGKQ